MLFNHGNKNCDNHGHSPRKHMLHMILCCGLPIVIIMAMPIIAGFSPAVAGVLAEVYVFMSTIVLASHFS